MTNTIGEAAAKTLKSHKAQAFGGPRADFPSKDGGKKPGLFRGVAVDLSPRMIALFWVLFALIQASFCFSQFGIMSFGNALEGDVNFIFLFIPIALGALLLGFVPGVLLAVEAGILLMARAAWTPTSYFDLFLSDPYLSLVPLCIGGLVMAAIFTWAGRLWPGDVAPNLSPIRRLRIGKAIAILVGCLLLCAAFSLGSRYGLYCLVAAIEGDTEFLSLGLSETVLTSYVLAETLVNTVILSVICILAETLDINRRCNVWESNLRSVFNRWLLLGVVLVFMGASATSFCLETYRANENTAVEMNSQLDYLQSQVDDHEQREADLREVEGQLYIDKAKAAAKLISVDSDVLANHDRLVNLASMLGLESLAVTDSKGVVIADSEYDDGVGYDFSSSESTQPYMKLIDGADPIAEELRPSINPDGTESDDWRVFAGAPRLDVPGIVQISASADEYRRMMSAASIEHLLDSYKAEDNAVLAIVKDYQVIASNDPRLKGANVAGSLVESEEDFDILVSSDEPVTTYDSDAQTVTVFKARTYGDYQLLDFMPLPETYKGRVSTLLSNTAFFIIMFAVVFLMASRLLRDVVVNPIKQTNSTLEEITEGDLDKRVNVRNVTEFASLSSGINTTVAALKDYIVEAEQRNAQELVTAKAIQESALPRDFPPFPDIDRFDIYASMKTAKEVGGDFYDFFLIDDGKLGFLLADVSGKGIPASLFMMTAKTQIRTYMESGLPVAEAVDAANHQLCLGNDAGMFVTMFACVLDYNTGELTYANAGHNPPLIHQGESWEWMRNVSGMPLGLFDGIPYDQFSVQLGDEDMIYLYTDGVTEAMNTEGELFGEDRLVETLGKYTGMNARSVCVGVRRALTDFTRDAEQSDDITMLALKYGVPPEPRAVMILPAVDTQLVHVYNFIHEELHRRGAPKSVRNPLDIAAEELFVNVCHYAYPDATPDNPGEVRIAFEYQPTPPSLTVEISDDGVPYNPLAKPDAVTPDDVMEVPIGGLGILMAKKSVDDMTYERRDNSNILTFRKGW